MAISSTKDVIFSGLVLLSMVLSLQVMESTSKYRKNFLIIILIIVTTLMLLFRNNAAYAGCLFLVYVFILAAFRKINWKICVYVMCCLLLYKTIDVYLTSSLNAEAGNIREALSIPSQQFGRIYNSINSPEDNSIIMKIVDEYYLEGPYEYNPRLSDPMKGKFLIHISTVNYIKDSAKLFLEYPIVSLDSFLYLSEGGWDINDIGLHNNDDEGYLCTHIDMYGSFGIVHESKLPQLKLFLDNLMENNKYQDWPIISMLFAPAFYVWIMVVCTLGFAKTRNINFLLPIGFLWCLLLTVLAGPATLTRYLYPFFVCSPILLCMLNISFRSDKRL